MAHNNWGTEKPQIYTVIYSLFPVFFLILHLINALCQVSLFLTASKLTFWSQTLLQRFLCLAFMLSARMLNISTF